jgi:methylenetetrahydrofolate dehydrogenase (NADP+)/methenyltetrahydrofolate cyclohydrolase
MTATIINGKAVAEALRQRIAARVTTLGYRPGLRVVRVGEDPASVVYVKNKERAAAACGFDSATIVLPEATPEAELLRVVRGLNEDAGVDGILVQFPLPGQIRQEAVIDAIDPAKDVDGLHPWNAGRLASGAPMGKGYLVPCTPRGVMHLLAAADVSLRGARAVVVGRSVLVGKPVAQLLLAADATVTMAHSRTRDIAAECRRAEVLVAAVGRAELVRGDWVAEGATVIDVGINRTAEGRLVGDVEFTEAARRAGAITPVPGGVGPMTIACLLENTLEAAIRRRG